MDSFSRETLFTDLPGDIKQKIVNIRNLSTKEDLVYHPVALKEFTSIPVPSSVGIYNEFLGLYRKIEKIGPYNAERQLEKELEELETFVKIYKNSIEEKDFMREMETTIRVLEAKYHMLNKKRGKKY